MNSSFSISDKLISFKLEQLAKAFVPMEIMLSGIVIVEDKPLN
jgi:hypothetical protein